MMSELYYSLNVRQTIIMKEKSHENADVQPAKKI